jgi:hypothetical protein
MSENWSKQIGSKVRSIRALSDEWAAWEQCASASGMTLNAWIRSWLNECVRYDQLRLEEDGNG